MYERHQLPPWGEIEDLSEHLVGITMDLHDELKSMRTRLRVWFAELEQLETYLTADLIDLRKAVLQIDKAQPWPDQPELDSEGDSIP
jgi:hypothetical protein